MIFVLVHSPLAGPLTWVPVADELTRRGVRAVAPVLECPVAVPSSYWELHTQAVAHVVSGNDAAVIVGHSGAGPLLPAIGAAIEPEVTCYIFVDSDIPRDCASRLDLFEPAESAEVFRRSAEDGMIQPWNYTQLQGLIQDADTRRSFSRQLRLIPLAVYEEPLPVPTGWPDVTCGYIRLSDAYPESVETANRPGWRFADVGGGHFGMLNDRALMAETLLDLCKSSD